MWLFYQIAVGLALLVAGPFLLVARGRHYLESCRARLGLAPQGEAPRSQRPVWLHAVSVGEVGVAATFARSLPRATPLLVTTITPTGQARARSLFGDRATVTYLPFELRFAVERFFRRFEPRCLILSEGDYWPLVLRGAQSRHLPVAVVNGRVGDRSFRRMARLERLLAPLVGPVDRFAVQTAEDRRRLLALGVPAERVIETGNLKFETGEPSPCPEAESWLEERAGGRPVLLAGSTMRQEEAQVLEAFEACGGGERALLTIAPRHPERFAEVEMLIRSRPVRLARRSSQSDEPRPDVVLLDTVGELAALYRLAAGAFIGGTLVPTGGHNPLEAARFAVPIAIGPSMENFRAIAELFDEASAWERVRDAAELAAVWKGWLDDPEAARSAGRRGEKLVAAHRGALARTVEALAPMLGPLLASPNAPETGPIAAATERTEAAS